MYWDQLTYQQLDALDRNLPVVLPVAATEQHGPHLPVATDRMIGEHFCRALHEVLPDEVLILPAVSVGCSEHHMDFTGTLTLRHDTFIQQVGDLCRSVARHGFRRILILNSHGGNQGAGQVALEAFGVRHPEMRIAFASWWRIGGEALARLSETTPGGTGHAGEFETSLMLLIAPDLVHSDRIEARANIETFDWAEGDLIRGPKAALYRSFRQITRNGAMGDPDAGNAEKGEKITEAVTTALVQIVSDLGGGRTDEQ